MHLVTTHTHAHTPGNTSMILLSEKKRIVEFYAIESPNLKVHFSS